MTEARSIPDLSTEGAFAFHRDHDISGILDKSIEAFEEAALRFSRDAISDETVRQRYNANIKRVSDEVRAQVQNGSVTVKEGAEFCQQMRNKIMAEARAVTSPQGLAFVVKRKPFGKTMEQLLSEKSQDLYKRPFSSLTDAEKNAVYYRIVESGGRNAVDFTTNTKRLRVVGKVCILITAVLATYEVATAENKPKEAMRQGAIIGGGAAGGWLAGLAVSSICGPGAPVCAIAVVLVGCIAGGMAADAVVDTFDEELEEFTKWQIR